MRRSVRRCLHKTTQQKHRRFPPMICSGLVSQFTKTHPDSIMSASCGPGSYKRLWAMKINKYIAMVERQRTKEHNVLSCLSRSLSTFCACNHRKTTIELNMMRAGATLLNSKEKLIDYMCSAPRSLLSQKKLLTSAMCFYVFCFLSLYHGVHHFSKTK